MLRLIGLSATIITRLGTTKARSNPGSERTIWRSALFVLSFALAVGAGFMFSSAHAAGTEADSARAVDQAFLSALAKTDGKAVRRMLAPDFSWTTSDGQIDDRSQALHALDSIAAIYRDETEVQNHFYGRLATVRGVHSGMRFLRIWAKRGGTW